MYPYSSIPEGIDGEFELVFGTSAASPVVGSIFTLVNDARIAVGKRSLGFLNPLVSRLAPVVIVKKPNVTSEKIYSDLFKPAFNVLHLEEIKDVVSPHNIFNELFYLKDALGTPGFTA